MKWKLEMVVYATPRWAGSKGWVGSFFYEAHGFKVNLGHSSSFVLLGLFLLGRKKTGRRRQRENETWEKILASGGKGSWNLSLKNKVGAGVTARWVKAPLTSQGTCVLFPVHSIWAARTACPSGCLLASISQDIATLTHMHIHTQVKLISKNKYQSCLALSYRIKQFPSQLIENS